MVEEHQFAGPVNAAMTASDVYAAVLLCADMMRGIDANALPVQELLDLQTMLLNLHIAVAELHRLIADQTASVTRDVYSALTGERPADGRPVAPTGSAVRLTVTGTSGTIDLLRLYQALAGVEDLTDISLVPLEANRVEVNARSRGAVNGRLFNDVFATYFPEGVRVEPVSESELQVTLGTA